MARRASQARTTASRSYMPRKTSPRRLPKRSFAIGSKAERSVYCSKPIYKSKSSRRWFRSRRSSCSTSAQAARADWVFRPTPCADGRSKPDESSASNRSEEHTSELQSLMRISYDVFCLKKKNLTYTNHHLQKTTHIN